ncbi:hypothetical protein HN903_01995 [archaeon]|jgi:hypothetical protein|nr:hypothetical protein [archaeon]MBT7128504.1 hypothetical protein [archaeon]
MDSKTRVKKTPEQIKEDILNNLNSGPKNAHEISEDINSNWLTIEKFLNELINEDKIIELISATKSKIYASKEDLSFFYLPLREEIREETTSLLYTINKIWKERVNEPLQRTVLQKLAVEFVENNNLENKVPIARFHYGQTLLLRYEEVVGSNEFKVNTEQMNNLLELIDKYKTLTANKARLKQYEKDSMKFYKDKEEVMNYFCLKDKETLSRELFNMMASYPTELMESFTLFDRIVYCANTVSISQSEEAEIYLTRLKEIFSLFWDLITTEAFFQDAKKAVVEEKIELFNQIKINYMNTKKTQVSRVLDDIESEINLLKIDSGSETSDLIHELLNS